MKWLTKIIVVVVVIVVMGAGAALAILNPQAVTINLWGWLTVEQTIMTWSLMMLAVGIVVGVCLASMLIIKLQSQLRISRHNLLQLQNALENKEIKK